MTIFSPAIDETGPVANRTWAWSALRWICVVPSYVLSGMLAFCAVWIGLGSLMGLVDDGLSWFSILIVVLAAFTGISVAALIAPKYRLVIALLFALLSVWLVPHPYTLETSPDGEAIPTSYELAGALLGSALALAFIFLWSKRPPQKFR